jgi:hypothetical protein
MKVGLAYYEFITHFIVIWINRERVAIHLGLLVQYVDNTSWCQIIWYDKMSLNVRFSRRFVSKGDFRHRAGSGLCAVGLIKLFKGG